MKVPIIRILEKVAYNRFTRFDENREIQLSKIFMNRFIKESCFEVTVGQDEDVGFEIEKNMFYNQKWTIRSRPYRDNSNDSEVEEAIYEYLTQLV
jgi:hypothetical protein